MGPSTAHKLILIRSELLQPGMFVAELDRSWLHTPFAEVGFLIASSEQLAQLRQLCRHVYIDPARSEAAPATLAELPSSGHHARPLAQARIVLKDSLATIAVIVRDARRHGFVDLDATARCASALVEQMLDGAEPFHWLLRTDECGSLLYRRAVGTAAVATTLGRRLGFDRPALEALAVGGLLLDIGKVAVPVPILAKPGALAGAEHVYVRKHVERGLELLSHSLTRGKAPPRALEMLAAHHERIDGRGYPQNLRGTEIPLFARIAAIADVFDALTLNRQYAAARSPHSALREVDVRRGTHFDAALVHELIHAIGPYPVGTPVGMMDGSIGFVCGQRLNHPLQPHVLVTHDAQRQPLREVHITASGPEEILLALPPHVVDVDANRVEDALHDFHQLAA